MKKIVYFAVAALLALSACTSSTKEENKGENQTDKVAASVDGQGLPVVIDFSAEWCGWCHKLEPVLQQVEDKYEGRVIFKTIDVDQEPEIARTYGITGMPTLVFLNSAGKEVDRIEGYTNAANIEASVEKILK